MRFCKSFVAALILLATVCAAQNTSQEQKKKDVSLITRILDLKWKDADTTDRWITVKKARVRGNRRRLEEEEIVEEEEDASVDNVENKEETEEEKQEIVQEQETEEVHENEFQFTGSAARRDPGGSWAMSVLGFGVACVAYGGLVVLTKKRFQSKSLSEDLMQQGDAKAGVLV